MLRAEENVLGIEGMDVHLHSSKGCGHGLPATAFGQKVTACLAAITPHLIGWVNK